MGKGHAGQQEAGSARGTWQVTLYWLRNDGAEKTHPSSFFVAATWRGGLMPHDFCLRISARSGAAWGSGMRSWGSSLPRWLWPCRRAAWVQSQPASKLSSCLWVPSVTCAQAVPSAEGFILCQRWFVAGEQPCNALSPILTPELLRAAHRGLGRRNSLG